MFTVTKKNSKKRNSKKKNLGFTLLEILIALFVFSIVSFILMHALRNMIDIQARTEAKATRLRQLQLALLMMSRDISETLNRPIVNAQGKEELAFSGSARDFSFTHGGLANPNSVLIRSSLERTQYTWHDATIWRTVWPVLDQAPATQSHARPLITQVEKVHFQYLDANNRFYDDWPLGANNNQPLPHAILITLTLSGWGKLTQLYVIPTQGSKNAVAPPTTPNQP